MIIKKIHGNPSGTQIKVFLINTILGGRGGVWTVESTPINICEYFKNGLQHRFEIF